MASESNTPDPQPERLPFEPGRKKAAKPAKPAPEPEKKASMKSSGKSGLIEKRPTSVKKPAARPAAPAPAPIPEVVTQRMARRMAFFCGIPTTLGIATFVVSYFIVTQGIYKLPNVAVVLVSMLFFGLGVIGLSYGVLSASWDEDRVGGLVGASEFTTNVGRLAGAWKEARARQKQPRSEN
ncbi:MULTISPECIES: PAM68 family protein [Leptolyngbya]|uniref:PAM68 family protein n=1 Tax=Leptolyngbya TaxID=47251 RepID=UPI0016894E3D|nr:PAM68 family protein [Leptolyngbya sp. FACHB-1624]MBD1855413.1 PAM68 family protein [Leptolyngbya sp. FACHB-1624]